MPPVAGYTPDAMGFYVPPGGAKLLDIQTGQPADTKNFTPPPTAPDFNTVGVTPGSRMQVAVAPTDGGPDPTLGNLALYKGPATGTGTKLSAAGPAISPTSPTAPPAAPPPGVQPPDTDHRPPPSPNAPIAAPAPTGDLQAFGQQAAAKYGVPWNVFYWAIQGESSWNPNVGDSSAGAQGIAQFIPGTAQQYGVNVKDPRSSLDGAARYLSTLYRQSGSWVGALTGYLTGDPNRQPPLDVLEQNPAYATAYRNAGYTADDRLHQGNVEKIRQAYDEKAAHANEGLREALKQLNSGEGDIGKAMEQIRRAREKSDAAQDAAMKAIQQQPKAPVIDGVQHINGIATIVGLLGGLFTKAPMLASTNAAAAALEAYNAGDLRAFHIAHDNWKEQTDYLFKLADMNAQRVRDVISEEKLPLDEKRAKVDALLRALGLQQIADDARISGLSTVEDWAYKFKQLENERKRYEAERDRPIELYDKQSGSYYRFYPISGRREDYPKGSVPASAATRGALPPEQEAAVKRRDDQYVADNPTATPQQIAEQHEANVLEVQRQFGAAKRAVSGAAADENAYTDTYVADKVAALGHPPTKAEIAQLRIEGRAEAKNTMRGIGVISDEAANLMAQQMILGNPRVLTSLPRSGPSRIKVENKFAELLRDQGDDAARAVVMNRLRMLEAESAARVAGRVTMQTEIFAREATDAGAEVVRTSKLVPRTDQPMFNKALQAFYRQEGDPNIIAFGAALSAFINAYGKMSNPTGTGVHDADKERIQQAIDQSLSQGQIEAGVNQVVTEGTIISNAARSAQERVLQGLAPTGAGPSTAAAPAPSSEAPPPGAPAGSRKAPDGHWYAPDPARPGKYLKVD